MAARNLWEIKKKLKDTIKIQETLRKGRKVACEKFNFPERMKHFQSYVNSPTSSYLCAKMTSIRINVKGDKHYYYISILPCFLSQYIYVETLSVCFAELSLVSKQLLGTPLVAALPRLVDGVGLLIPELPFVKSSSEIVFRDALRCNKSY